MDTFHFSITRIFKGIWKFLAEPFETLPPTDRRFSIISSLFLLIGAFGVWLEQIVGGNTPFIALLLLVVSYFVSRTRWYKVATFVLLVTLSFPSYIVALTVPNPSAGILNNAFIWVILPLILSSLIYSVRATVIFAVANIFSILALPLIRSELTLPIISGSLGFYSIATVFVLTVMIQRNQLENVRQKELLENRNQLAEEAVKRKKFAEQAQRRADQLVMVNEVSRVVSSLQGLDEMLGLIFDQVKRHIPLDVFYVALYDERTDLVSYPVVFEGGKRWEEKPARLEESPLISRVILSRQPFLWNQAETELDDFSSYRLLGDPSRNTVSILITPLQLGDHVVGVISAQSYALNLYNDEHLMLLNAISQQVAIAIENAHLFEQTTKRAQRLGILNDVGRELSTLTDLSTLMENVYRQVKKALSVDLFFINLVDPQKNEVRFPFMYDHERRWEQEPKSMEEVDGTFTGKALRTRQPLLINDWPASAKQADSSLTMVGDEQGTTKSLMFAPMLYGNETIGVISAQSYRINAYNEEDLNLLSGIANHVAVAIQNTRLLEETKQNEGYLATLNELGRVVSELRDLPDLLEVIYREVKKHLNVDAFFVGLHHPESDTVSYPIMYDEEVKYQITPDAVTPHSFLYGLLRGDKATRILRRADEIELVNSDRGMLGNSTKKSASLMYAPLKVAEQAIGIISVQSYTLNAYTDDDLNLLVGIGNQVGVSIQNARLLEETRQNAEHLSILNEVGRAVSKIMNLPDLLEVIYVQGRKSLSLDAFFVGLYHPETEEVSFPIMYDSGVRYEQTRGLVSQNSFLRRFLNGEKSILMNRTEEELAEGVTYQKTLGKENKISASLMAAPLISRDQVIGVISAQSYSLNAYNELDLKLLEGIANQISIAIENSRLYTSAQQEIKERERVEMELQKERDFAVQVMKTLGQGVSVSMLDGVYEYVNPAYAHMLGYEPEDMIGEPSEQFALPDDASLHTEQREHRQAGEATTYETRLRHKDGHIVHALVTGVPRYLNGRIIGSIAAITDLTERKQAEIERENLFKEMEAKNAELERFTYTVSHDLKSPIVTIGGFLGFLEEDIQKGRYDRIPKSASRIREATKKMQRLLSELLELSRIGRIANPSVDVPFGELVIETLELVEGQLREKQVEVQVDAEFPMVHVDRVRMMEVIQNLITNSIKFMGDQKNPKIQIGVEARDNESIFFVKDNGIGISPEFHERIFGLFNKLDPFSEGTGIGLALVKRIVEVHGGKIWVESEPGKGSTFFFTIENIKPEETV